MLYLLDANVPIDANRYYYPMDRVPQFWEWLIALAQSRQIKIPREICEEVSERTDAVSNWLKENSADMLLQETPSPPMVSRVILEGYAPDLTDDEIEKTGKDPFLIAYALADSINRTVVSNEVSRPTIKRANRHVPDVCQHFNIRPINVFTLIQELNFRTR